MKKHTIRDILVRRVSLLRDADQLVDLVFHPAFQHPHFFQDHPCLHYSVHMVSRTAPASGSILRAERSLRRRTFR